jgi:hypothetical protein
VGEPSAGRYNLNDGICKHVTLLTQAQRKSSSETGGGAHADSHTADIQCGSPNVETGRSRRLPFSVVLAWKANPK